MPDKLTPTERKLDKQIKYAERKSRATKKAIAEERAAWAQVEILMEQNSREKMKGM